MKARRNSQSKEKEAQTHLVWRWVLTAFEHVREVCHEQDIMVMSEMIPASDFTRVSQELWGPVVHNGMF